MTRMSKLIPDTPAQRIDFFRARIDAWKVAPDAIGLSRSDVEALEDAIDLAESRLTNAQSMKQAALAATGQFHDAAAEMTRLGRIAVRAVKVKAARDGANVYRLAEIDPPDTVPTRRGAPLTPVLRSIRLRSGGRIELKWRPPDRNSGTAFAGNTSFIIERSLIPPDSAPGPWSLIGLANDRVFIDRNVPPGMATLRYRITAMRNDERSDACLAQLDLFSSQGRLAMPLAA